MDWLKRKNQDTRQYGKCGDFECKVTLQLWAEALFTACHVHNRITSKKTNV